jgi:hypothetical protein
MERPWRLGRAHRVPSLRGLVAVFHFSTRYTSFTLIFGPFIMFNFDIGHYVAGTSGKCRCGTDGELVAAGRGLTRR